MMGGMARDEARAGDHVVVEHEDHAAARHGQPCLAGRRLVAHLDRDRSDAIVAEGLDSFHGRRIVVGDDDRLQGGGIGEQGCEHSP
jgi:hypothetical protein